MKTPKCPKCGHRLPSPKAQCAQCLIKAYIPNPDPIKIVSVPRCIGCGVRAPWCTCGRGDYRTTTFTPVPDA